MNAIQNIDPLEGHVLIMIPVDERQKAILEAPIPARTEIRYRSTDTITNDDLENAAVIVGNVDPAFLKVCRRLRFMQLQSSGAEHYLEPGVMPANALLANSAGAFGLAISEHMLGMLLCLMKNLQLYRDNQNQALWKPAGKVSTIVDARILVVGLGDIGSEFARRVKALGAYTIGIRRTQVDKPEWLDELHTPESIDRLLPTIDVLALTLPGSSTTVHMISAERIHLLKQGAYVLNIGRGTAIDTTALTEALRSGKLAGAGLDVTDPEPLPADHPLWQVPNALLTPHVSGGFNLPMIKERILSICAENLDRFFHGVPIRNELRPG